MSFLLLYSPRRAALQRWGGSLPWSCRASTWWPRRRSYPLLEAQLCHVKGFVSCCPAAPKFSWARIELSQHASAKSFLIPFFFDYVQSCQHHLLKRFFFHSVLASLSADMQSYFSELTYLIDICVSISLSWSRCFLEVILKSKSKELSTLLFFQDILDYSFGLCIFCMT